MAAPPPSRLIASPTPKEIINRASSPSSSPASTPVRRPSQHTASSSPSPTPSAQRGVATDGDVRVELPGARREPLAIGAVNHRPAIVYEQRAGLQEVTGRRVGKLASRISLRTGVPVAPARARDLKEVARERVTRLPGGALENDNVALHQRCGAP